MPEPAMSRRPLYRSPKPGSVGVLSHLGVVVPARNEEAHIAGCLAALDLAARVARLPLDVVVVLDSCDDETSRSVSDVAGELTSRLHVVRVGGRRVGAARRRGVSRLLELSGGDESWVSTTDADTVVPPDWFLRQLEHRATGAALVVGTVHVDDWLDRGHLRPHWERAYGADREQLPSGHRHVHGANLAFDAAAYLRSGGFAEVANDEDVRLVQAFQDAGEPVVWASDMSAATSARRLGRAPHGFAAYLDQLAHVVEAPKPSLEMS